MYSSQSDPKIDVVQLWANAGCNSRCIMCDIWREGKSEKLTAAELAVWTGEWKEMGIKKVELCGEPTLHPELEPICEALKEVGILVQFLTNGLLLEQSHGIIGEYASTLTVSLDGPPHVHNRSRGIPNAFERLSKGVEAVRRERPDLPIYGRCVVHKENFASLCDTVKTAKDLGLTSISFIGLDTTSVAFGRERLSLAENSAQKLLLSSADLKVLSSEIDAMEKKFAEEFSKGFIRESPDMLRAYVLNHFARALDPQAFPRPRLVCDAPWKEVVIDPSGDVKPCFFLPAYGNLKKDGTLSEILNSPKANRFRSELDINKNAVCQSCICPRDFSEARDGRLRSQQLMKLEKL